MKKKSQEKKIAAKSDGKKVKSAKRKPIKKPAKKIKKAVIAEKPRQKKLHLLTMERSQALKVFLFLFALVLIGLSAWAVKIYPEKDIRAKLKAIALDFNLFYQQASASVLDIARVVLPDSETDERKRGRGDNSDLSNCPDCPSKKAVFYDAGEEKKLTWGNPQAEIVFVVYNDFASPFAKKQALETLPILRSKLAERVIFQHRDFPLFELHPVAEKAAIAARCAARQDKFWSMHDRLFEYQQLWRDPETANDFFQIFAAETGLNGEEFSQCLFDPALVAAVTADYNRALQDGVKAAPTVKISKNGVTRTIEGILSAKDYERLINEL